MLKILIYTVVFVGGVFMYTKYLEKNSIFFPTKEIELTPFDVGFSYEEVYLKTADNVKLNGWFIPQAGVSKTLLVFHGNGGNISNRLDKLVFLYQSKVNIFIIDYRGYGVSEGVPSEKGVYLDSKAAYNYLVNELKVKPIDIILYGESLGVAIAIDLAAKEKVAALIMEGAFSSGKDMGRELYPYLPRFILPNVFNSLDKIKKINVPQLFIHAKDDEAVPFSLAKKLYNAANEPKEFVEIKGGHNGAFLESQEDYTRVISNFIEKVKQNDE